MELGLKLKVALEIEIQGAYDVEGAAALLNVGVATVWRRIKKGELSSFKLGDRTLIPAAVVEKARAPGARELSPMPGSN